MDLYKKRIINTPYMYNEYIHPEIINICLPLFESFDVKFFGYMRLFINGQYLAISSNLEWQKHFLEDLSQSHGKEFQHQVEILTLHKPKYFLWPEAPKYLKDQTLLDLYAYNLWNGFSIYKKEYNYIDSWSFAGSTTDEHLRHFYINNIPILNSFVSYFNQKIRPFIDLNDSSKLSKYSNFTLLPNLGNVSLNENDDKLKKFLNDTKLNYLNITLDGKEFSLSKREYECLANLSSGKSGKEIAQLLSISPRTVEYYINNIKLKTNLHYKSGLIKLYENIKENII